jgi:hypothetical protein
MKKTYSAPSAVAINLVAEGMMAASNESQIKYSSDESVNNESKILSNEKGWNSSSWTDED